MASSGIVKTNTVYDSYFWVKWELAGQDIAGNKSTISWSCGITPGHKFYSNAVKMSAVTINGSQVYAGGTYSNITDYKERTLASGTLTIAHDSDGSKTFTVAAFSGQVWKDSSYLTATAAAQSFALPTIPRATVPVIGAVVMGQTVTIGLPRAVSSFTHTLTYVFGSASGTIAEGAGTETQWAVPYDLAAQIPNSTSGTGTLTCKTYSGSTLIGTQAVNFTATVPSNSTTQPSDALAVSPVSSLAAPFNGLYIQGRTKAKITHTASGKYGATIKSYAATVDGQTYTGQAPTTDILATPGTLTITGTAIDSRGIVGTALASIAVLAYTPPSVERNTSTDALICARALADGTLDDDGTALYVACSRKYSALNGNNAASVQVRYKAESGEWSDWVTFFAESASGDNYAGVIAGITLAVESPYTIELRAVDKLGESGGTLSFAVPTSEATVDLGEGGNSLGVGRRAHMGAEKRLDVAWDSNFEKNVRVEGDLFVGDLTSLKAALVDIFLPVGRYYTSSDPTSPAELFGGTWEEIHGRFLFAADDAHPAGSTGGEEAHTLTVGEMASHGNHLMQGRMYEELAENASNDSSYRSNTLYLPKTAFVSTGNINRGWKDWNGGEMYPAGTLKGGGNPHNNMPPYLAVYTWHRIA
nr:MAG TPA: baseplate protein [Caudoviricetes sp.]